MKKEPRFLSGIIVFLYLKRLCRICAAVFGKWNRKMVLWFRILFDVGHCLMFFRKRDSGF